MSAWGMNLKSPAIIAGPCSVESPAQLSAICTEMKLNNIKPDLFRAGVWKPRTRPGGFEGLGATALPWLEIVREELNVPITVEVGNTKHVEEALKAGIDVLWVGARTTVNPFSVQEIAEALRGVDIPVLVKNPMSPDLGLWVGAFERFNAVGIDRLAGIHRGFTDQHDKTYRNKPNWSIPIHLKREIPGIEVINDPSHITGKRDMILEVSQRALNFGLDGLMIETHHDPDNAWSDAAQQVTPTRLAEILKQLEFRETLWNENLDDQLSKFRVEVDQLDHQLMEILAERFKVIDKIGAHKRDQGLAVFQPDRWTSVMESRTKEGVAKNLSEKFMKELLFAIHEESVKRQEKQIKTQSTTNSLKV